MQNPRNHQWQKYIYSGDENCHDKWIIPLPKAKQKQLTALMAWCFDKSVN